MSNDYSRGHLLAARRRRTTRAHASHAPVRRASPALCVVVLLALLALPAALWLLRPRDFEARTLAVSEPAPGAEPAALISETHSPAATSMPLAGARAWQDALATALEGIRAERDPIAQSTQLDHLAEGLPGSELPAALAFLDENDASLPSRSLQLRLLHRWAADAPADAADWLSHASLGSARSEAVQTVAISWANEDLAAAAQWGRQLSSETERSDTLLNVAYEAARTQPVAALKLAQELPPGDNRSDLLVHAASQWAVQDPSAAADWARQIPEADLRERLLVEIAAASTDSDPVAAATLATNELPPGKAQSDAVVAVVQRWAQTQPGAAAEWVGSFPAGAVRDTAMEELARLSTFTATR